MKTNRFYKVLALSLLLSVSHIFAEAQERPNLMARSLPPVDFLRTRPAIDGALDSACAALQEGFFDTVETTSPNARLSPCSYRLGYTGEGLYLAIGIAKKTLSSRDRAYQNGDGFHMVLAIPAPDDSSTREFLVLAFSPLDTSRRRAFVWYRNVDLAFTILRGAELAVGSKSGATVIELFLPWHAVSPYHPWLLDSMGFNLCLVEASGENERTYHFVRLDEQIQSEQSPRNYSLLRFKPPEIADQPSIVVALAANHLFSRDTMRARVAGLSHAGDAQALQFDIRGKDSTVLRTRSVSLVLPQPPRPTRIDIDRMDVPPGNYSVRWKSVNAALSGELPLTVLPRFSRGDWTDRLNHVRASIRPASTITLEFLIDQIATSLEQLKSYDTGRELLSRIVSVDTLLLRANSGTDDLARQSGAFRRAYRSNVDSTLQPYSVRIPPSYSPTKPAPLLVYLHGSGQDDQGLFDRDTIDDGYIRLAPFGRGTSNVYTTDHAQDDIREAIDDVCRNYTIDTSRIILSGFSMGGYGVYRTYIENPRRFHALAVFSGSPNLATRWLGEGFPDFTSPSLLAAFKGMRMFVFHGGRDRNCPVEETDRLVANLRQAGAVVEYHREEDKGHDAPSPVVQQRYSSWLKTQLTIVDGH